MKNTSERGFFILKLVDLLDETQSRKLLIDLFRGPKCRYCGESVPERHLKRLYAGKEVYCGSCDSKFYVVGGTILAQTKLSYKQILKMLVMLDLGCRTKEVAETLDISTHAVPRWKRKLYGFENE